MPELYRKASLERISNPEQLDKTLKITSPLSWLVLIAITLMIVVAGVWSVYGSLPTTVTAPCQVVSPVSTNAVYSTETGTVVRLLVGEGAEIHEGEVLMVVGLPDGKEREIISDQNGIVSEVSVLPGSSITQNSEVVRVSPLTQADRVVVAYVPFKDIRKVTNAGMLGWPKDTEKVKRGPAWLYNLVTSIFPQAQDDGRDDVQVTLTYANSQTYGHMAGYILNVDSQPASTTSMGKVLGKENNQATTFAKDNIPVAAVTLGLHTSNGQIWWSNEKGMTQEVTYGAQGTVRFIIKKEPPISKLFTKLKEIWSGGD